MADKIVVMRAGHVEQIGDPLTLYDHPNNLFVAGFIGSPSMNFISGTVEPGGFRSENGTLWPLPAHRAAQLAGRDTIYGVRPEHLVLAAEGLPLTVQVTEPTGSETMVIGKVGDSPIICLLRERLAARPGSTIGVTVDPANVHLFDRQSEARIEAVDA